MSVNKEKVFDIKNFTKEGDNKAMRLQSLKLPRDLSLGGTKSKKVYAPNLNVIRNKDKTKEFLKKLGPKKSSKSPRDSKYNRHDNSNRYIQSSGVFSEGAGELRRGWNSEKRSSSGKDYAAPSSILLPTINRNSWNNINKKNEDGVLDELIGRDNDSDEEKMSFEPVTWSSQESKKNLQALKNLQIKKEENDATTEENTEVKIPIQEQKVDVTNFLLPAPFDNEDKYNDDNPELLLMKLPDSFAGKGLSDDPNVKKLFDYSLNDMLEGQIGKLCIRRSGKMEIHIGHIKYNVEPADFFTSTEQVVSFVEESAESKENALAVLGDVNNRFMITPTWDDLLTTKNTF